MDWNIKSALLAASAWLRASSIKGPNQHENSGRDSQQKNSGANRGHEPTANMRTEWATFRTLIREIQRTEENYQRAERDFEAAQLKTAKGLNRITIIAAGLNLLGLLGVVASVFIARKAAEDGQIAARAAATQATAVVESNNIMRQENIINRRPWIPPDMEVTGTIKFSETGGVIIPVTYKFVNMGLTPAMNVHPVSIVSFEWSSTETANIQKQICAANRKNVPVGPTVFPKQEISYGQAFNILGAEIFKLPVENGHKIFLPAIIGCVNYTLALTDELGQSGFIYRLWKNDLSNKWSHLYAGEGDIPASQVQLEKSTYGEAFFAN
jgi:hypothetical protein